MERVPDACIAAFNLNPEGQPNPEDPSLSKVKKGLDGKRKMK